MTGKERTWVIIWLFAGCLLVYLMVVIGGITRLTGSGLSITEWKVIMGTFPPMNDVQWHEAFSKYQQSPQFQKVNFDFSLDDFKSIFWWEYIHRLVGRLISIVFLIPFCIFIYKKILNRKLILKCLFIFFLGGLQGALGWYMVYSGLINEPRVSHFRLAAHLMTAFVSFGYIFYVMLDLIFENEKVSVSLPPEKLKFIKRSSLIFFVLVLLQIMYGAFTAGLHAGKIYNTFPKMENSWMPEAVTAMDSITKNFTENLAGVQFIHRCLAWMLLFSGVFLFMLILKNFQDKAIRTGAVMLAAALGLQFTLGIFTLIYSVPVILGVLHQSGAFFLFAAALFIVQRLAKSQTTVLH